MVGPFRFEFGVLSPGVSVAYVSRVLVWRGAVGPCKSWQGLGEISLRNLSSAGRGCRILVECWWITGHKGGMSGYVAMTKGHKRNRGSDNFGGTGGCRPSGF